MPFHIFSARRKQKSEINMNLQGPDLIHHKLLSRFRVIWMHTFQTYLNLRDRSMQRLDYKVHGHSEYRVHYFSL